MDSMKNEPQQDNTDQKMYHEQILSNLPQEALITALASRGTPEEFDQVFYELARERLRLNLPILEATIYNQIDNWKNPNEAAKDFPHIRRLFEAENGRPQKPRFRSE
jgi:hypothetical protein